MDGARSFPIPARLNLLLLTVASAVALGALGAASHGTGLVVVVSALAFAAVNNTLFALLHESVHGALHPNATINRWGGRLAAVFFGTGRSLQRAFHLTHHRFNRTVHERFDYLQPGESPWLKRAQWYAILTGLYWFFVPLAAAAYLLFPRLLRARTLRDGASTVATQTASETYLAALDDLPATARIEVLGTFAGQALIAWALHLTPAGWLACYAAFAVSWSALQYADHAYAPLDVREGAWNLRVNPVARAFFLDYFQHRAHHEHPTVPWIHLHTLVDPAAPAPTFWAIWRRMWRGPVPLPTPPSMDAP